MVESVAKWVTDQISPQVLLKCPDDNNVEETWTYHQVHPSVLAMFVPTKDKVGPSMVPTIPSICVDLLDGDDRPFDMNGTSTIRLNISAWNPGTHGTELWEPQTDGSFVRSNAQDAMDVFTRNAEGWKDVWNVVDRIRGELRNAVSIGDLRIKLEDGISYGPFLQEDAVSFDYPYWYAWVKFGVEYHDIADTKFQDLL